jgi:23S rRNA pseudouridine2604 synthase
MPAASAIGTADSGVVAALRMRLNKFMSETGVCSRREADSWIELGRVAVNGKRAELGTQVNDGDEVRLDGRPLGAKKKPVYLALNKPVGITCTTERHVAGNIVDFVNHRDRIFPIGRLDKDSEGLILLTNDGDIVNEILRVENRHEKEYIVTVDRPVTGDFLAGMASGVRLPELEVTTQPCRTSRISDRAFRIVLTQGLNRQIRRMCEVFGYEVRRLQRVRIINLRLGSLKPGQWRDLTAEELKGLLPGRDFGSGKKA